MQIEKLTTTTSAGEELTARVSYPVDDDPVAFALFAHCFGGAGGKRAADPVIRNLTGKGFAVVHFDIAGLDEDVEDNEFSADRLVRADDISAMAHFMSRELGRPTLLVGHSLAGAAVVLAASEISSLKAVATIGAPLGAKYLQPLLSKSLGDQGDDEPPVANLADRRIPLSPQFVDDFEGGRIEKLASSMSAALLVIHASGDQIVSVESATNLFQSATQPKSILVIEGGDHFLSDDGDARHAAKILGTWAERYGDTGLQEAKYIQPDDNRIYTRTGPEGYLTEIMANGHPLVSDEPKSVGGTDAGPSPYDYIAAALGACTGMTLRMYADRKEWPLLGITVRLTHQKIHARDCETCETDEDSIDHIDREIGLEGPLSNEQRERLIEIANRCPVHRTLIGSVHVQTKEMRAP